jgi:hypothetical protein
MTKFNYQQTYNNKNTTQLKASKTFENKFLKPNSEAAGANINKLRYRRRQRLPKLRLKEV